MKIRKATALALAVILALGMTACGKTETADTAPAPSQAQQEETQNPESSETAGVADTGEAGSESDSENGGESKTLVAFFSWAYNAEEFNPDDYDVDATGQASVYAPGDVGIIAHYIEARVPSDEFIITQDYEYSADYNVCIVEHHDQRDRGEIPQLTAHIENLEDYDTIFLGFPNWNYGLPMAIRAFVNDHDLSGKTIIPFVCHGTGGLASTITQLNEIVPEDCTILQEYHVYENDVKEAEDEVLEWLSGLGY